MLRRAFCLTLVAVCAAFGFEFSKGGKAQCVIATAEGANSFETLAAEDLRNFLGQITGAEFKVVAEAEAKGCAIYVGQTKFAAAKGVDFSTFDKEEWMLQEQDGALIVSGGRPIGTFYGVWFLLNKLGCHVLTMEQTAVKKNPSLNVRIAEERRKPAFAGRIIYDGFAVTSTIMGIPEKDLMDYKMWLLRSGINGKQHRRVQPLYEGDMRRVSTDPQWHTLGLYVPISLYDKHPEFFSMNEKGVRVRPRTSQAGGSVCMSNPEVQEIALGNLRRIVKNDREKMPRENWPVLYDVTLLDNYPIICLCPNCKAIIDEEGGNIGLLLRFINHLAENIEKEFSGVMIRTSAYGATGSALNPKTKPAKNVLIEVADMFVDCDCFHPLSHEFNKPALDKFEACRKLGAPLAVWDYWNIFFEPPRIETITHAIQPDLQYFHSIGVVSLFLEAERPTYKPQNFIDMNYFIASRLMMDPYEDVNALIDFFIKEYYGAAADDIKTFYEQLSSDVSNYKTLQKGMRSALWDFITPEYTVSTYKMLKAAAAKNPEGSLQRRHVTDEMLPLLWLVISKYFRYKKAFEAEGIALKTLQQDCHDYSVAHMMRFHPTKPDFETPWAKTMRDFQEEFDKVTNKPLPVPDKFKDVPDEKIRVFGTNSFEQKPNYHATIVDDKDSAVGKALCSADPNPDKHGVKTVRDPKGRWAFGVTEFGYSGLKPIIVKDIPEDEKYHWYKIPNNKIDDRGSFYGHLWYIHMNLGAAFQPDDGVSNENVWDIWFSAKFTGPAYVNGSTQKNAIWVDQVLLLKADAEKYVKP
ncbi:MAG: DUF4838 domain-containing protein [Victivallales bacterium]|nr:DUF4838 domain-containing protein [Victivallales bacterium]